MKFRKQVAYEKRQEAYRLAYERPHPRHISNADEHRFRHTEEIAKCHTDDHLKKQSDNDGDDQKESIKTALDIAGKPSYLVSFTKGLPHNHSTGLVENPEHMSYFIKGIDSGDPRDFRDTPLGQVENVASTSPCTIEGELWRSEKIKKITKEKRAEQIEKGEHPDFQIHARAWESQSAGLSFDLEGPDAQAVTMPPAPVLGSDELTAEMAEVYAQSILRDVPFHTMSAGSTKNSQVKLDPICTTLPQVKIVKECTDQLSKLAWFDPKAELKLNVAECARRRALPQTTSSAFRGITRGDDIGPYLSQFLLIGNTGINGNDEERSPSDGMISYGSISVDQRVRTAEPSTDYMTEWDEWYDVQNGADLRKFEDYVDQEDRKRRFMHTPRDLATYVHYDALYEAYLNACLIMLGKGVKFDAGIPFQEPDDRDHQQGFAHFGGPHILSLVTEVATRALKAVRFQKYNVHRRCRPEVLAARVHKADMLSHMAPELKTMRDELDKGSKSLLSKVRDHNSKLGEKTELLPMAFCEGSPMHPAYGAGHATVAGACVTILKAFFDHHHILDVVKKDELPKGKNRLAGFKDAQHAYVSVEDGTKLKSIPVMDQDCNPAYLTVEGELNKLASNISIGRNWAGVHYFTDYYESLLMGEQIAIGILEEQKLMYIENFSMTIPLFNGDAIRI